MTRGARAHELVADVGGLQISGLVAETDARPARALVLALPGNSMRAAYFHGPVERQGSLLDLGAEHGFTVWAIDRPGYGASAGAPGERVTLFGQVDLVYAALEWFADRHDVGAGYFVVAHSYGLKLALTMAADARSGRFLGIDGVGTGYHYTWDHERGPRGVAQPGDRGAPWGPGHLYPDGTFDRGRLPLGRAPDAQGVHEAREWPSVLESVAPKITIPVRFTYGDHERLWPIDEASLRELRSLFTASPRVETFIQPGAGHNVSLSHAAREYHQRALANAAACIAEAGFS